MEEYITIYSSMVNLVVSTVGNFTALQMCSPWYCRWIIAYSLVSGTCCVIDVRQYCSVCLVLPGCVIIVCGHSALK